MKVFLANANFASKRMNIFFATRPGARGDNNFMEEIPFSKLNRRPSILVSFFYLDGFWKNRDRYIIEDWILDSGAFSAKNSGVEISLGDYIETCKKLKWDVLAPKEIYSLDAIGDWKTSRKNTDRMWKAGVEAIPVFHVGEPFDVLVGMVKDYPKVALGGLVRRSFKEKYNFIARSFEKVWPKRLHGFGLMDERLLMNFPFHSVDATNWELVPCAFGRWKKFGKMSVRGSKQNLRSEIEYYFDLEDKLKVRWKKEMALLESLR